MNPRCQIVACDAALEVFGAGRDDTSGGDLLARAAPDVLLVDLGLPHVSGIEIIRDTALRFILLR